jgi:hypothetical protein
VFSKLAAYATEELFALLVNVHRNDISAAESSSVSVRLFQVSLVAFVVTQSYPGKTLFFHATVMTLTALFNAHHRDGLQTLGR